MTDRIEKTRRIADWARKNRAEKDFILNISCLSPINEERKEALKAIGFDSLTHFITDSTGVFLNAETFVNLAFAFDVYENQACEVVKYLVTQEGWVELLQHVEAEHQVACGARLNAPKTKTSCNNVTSSPIQRGNGKSYTMQRLARDSETDPKVADIYEEVKRGAMSANKAAIALGWRPRTITIREDVESAAKTLRSFFTDEALAELKAAL